MNGSAADQIFVLFLLFCRIGGCLLFAPGFSSPRIAVSIRLFSAMALTAAVAPLIHGDLAMTVSTLGQDRQVHLILTETVTGASIGLMARLFFLSLQFAATAISNFIGLAGIPGVPLEEGDTGSPLATLASSAAIMMTFVMGLHVELIQAVIDSYDVLKPGEALPVKALAFGFVDTASQTSVLALRLAAPFLVYGVIVNFALGMGNRFANHLSVYHATTGVVILGGFLLLYLIVMDWNLVFLDSYRSWLLQGGF